MKIKVQNPEGEVQTLLSKLSNYLLTNYSYEIRKPWSEENRNNSQTVLGFIWSSTIWFSNSLKNKISNFQEFEQTIVSFKFIEDFIDKCLYFISDHPSPELIVIFEDYKHNLQLMKAITGKRQSCKLNLRL